MICVGKNLNKDWEIFMRTKFYSCIKVFVKKPIPNFGKFV